MCGRGKGDPKFIIANPYTQKKQKLHKTILYSHASKRLHCHLALLIWRIKPKYEFKCDLPYSI